MNDPARSYMEELRHIAVEQNRLHMVKQIKNTKGLDIQLTELMSSLPPQLRDRPWSMAELVCRLQGKYRDRPHAQQVGDALRRLGWQRLRLYGKGFDGVRVWVRL